MNAYQFSHESNSRSSFDTSMSSLMSSRNGNLDSMAMASNLFEASIIADIFRGKRTNQSVTGVAA